MKKELYKYDMSGLDNVWLANGFTIHETPYGKGVSIEDAKGLDVAIANALVFKSKIISGKEIRFLRVLFGMSQANLAKRIGVEVQAIHRWEKCGRTKKPNETLARYCFAALLNGDAKITSIVEAQNSIERAQHYSSIVLSEIKGVWKTKMTELEPQAA